MTGDRKGSRGTQGNGLALEGEQNDQIRRAHASHPRTFYLEYDTSRIQSRSRARSAQAREILARRTTLYGAQWPSTDTTPGGSISLSNGVFFSSLSELEHEFERYGQYHLTWLDDSRPTYA